MRHIFTLLCFSVFISVQACAGVFIYEPKDPMLTYEQTIDLRGVASSLNIIKINNRPFNPAGPFSCGLVLGSGKNLAEIRAQGKDGSHQVKKIRILSLKSYPDIETLYEGKKHWARSQIVHLATLKLIEGYPDDNFYPGNPITRGELATWVARVKKLPIPELSADVFLDVPKEHWRAPYVKAVVDAGFMRGYSKEKFGVEEPLSRRQAAEVAVLSEGYDIVEKIKPLFVDVPKEEEGSYPIYVAKEKGLVLGISKDISIFDPDRALNRGEAAVLLSRFREAMILAKDLFDFKKGYTSANYCSLNVLPEIVSFKAEPGKIPVNQQNIVQLRAEIGSRDGFFPVSKVKVDLSELGGMPDIEMFDDGTGGDEQANDLIYSLNISVQPKETGDKKLRLSVDDRLGWESKKETPLLVLE